MAQIGIALGALGVVISFMGLFPGITGISTGTGIGSVQFASVLMGFALLSLGGFVYAKFTLYAGRASTFVQQIGIRLMLTGIVLAAMTGFADVLGFGSHTPTPDSPAYFGTVQAVLVLIFLIMALLGIFVYAISGTPPDE
ncbi:MAG: hypothetical protein KME04_07815 [Pleurocapsa minor GSE-CHR-MK-17-07R]|jgi:uncharacterized membrane protein|nr:hypothetical protein [Pleurocapsa minor GSE-CHR-MK 17-07R]